MRVRAGALDASLGNQRTIVPIFYFVPRELACDSRPGYMFCVRLTLHQPAKQRRRSPSDAGDEEKEKNRR